MFNVHSILYYCDITVLPEVPWYMYIGVNDDDDDDDDNNNNSNNNNNNWF